MKQWEFFYAMISNLKKGLEASNTTLQLSKLIKLAFKLQIHFTDSQLNKKDIKK